MTGTNHGLTGAVIALIVKRPELALPLSFISHFICDSIPHFGNPKMKLFGKSFTLMLTTDFLVAVSIMAGLAVLFPNQKWLIWECMILAASPDLMWAYYRLYKEKIKHKAGVAFGPISRFHAWIQWSETVPGIFIEIGWFMLMTSIILGTKK